MKLKSQRILRFLSCDGMTDWYTDDRCVKQSFEDFVYMRLCHSTLNPCAGKEMRMKNGWLFRDALCLSGLKNRCFLFSSHWNFFFENVQSLELFFRKRPIIGTFFLMLFLAFPAIGFAGLARSGSVGEISNAVHAVRIELEAALGKSVPSLSICLQTSNETVFASSASSPELALTTNTTFRFASNTKNFTATAVLHMQQRGWLNVTDPITNAIPGYAEPYIPTGTNWAIPYKEQITIEQLLQHSAGVYDVDNDPVPGCGGGSYVEWMLDQNSSHQFTPEELVGVVALHQLTFFEPGTGYHYSDTGYSLLAAIVGRVYSLETGEDKNLTDYLYDHGIADPDIRFPYLATDTALPDPFVPGTVYLPSDVTEVISNYNVSQHVGEGNGYGTLPALNRHIRSVMKGENVLSNDMVHLMQTSTSVSNANYGLGCQFKPDLGFGHGGAVAGYLTLMSYNPETDVSVAGCLPLWDLSGGMNTLLQCNQSVYDAAYRALEALGYPRTPTLTNGSHTNFALSAGATNVFYVNAVDKAYYAFIMSNATTDVRISIAPAVDPEAAQGFTNTFTWQCEATGTYRLTLTASADTPCSLTLTGWKIEVEANYSALDWTNAFIAAHETFSRQYAFTDWKSVDWDALYSNTLPRIAAAQAVTNEVEYFAALNAYAGAIPDSHVYLGTTNKAVPKAWAQQVAGGGYGLALAELDDGRIIAAALLTNGTAQLAGMQTGTEIVSWNGLAPTSAIAQIDVAAYPLKTLAVRLTLSPQATLEHMRLEQARLLVRGPVGTNVNVQFINPGASVTQTVALTAIADTNATFGLLDFAWLQDLSAAPVEYSMLSNGLGYVVVRAEINSEVVLSNMTGAISAFAASNVPGVIVDVRGNLGGDDELAAALCGFFYRTNAFYERQSYYNTLDGTFTVFTLDDDHWVDHLDIEPQAAYYGGPVAVLVNPGCVSSGEGIAMGIGALPNAKTIGFHGTDGSFGMAGAAIWLPGGHVIGYPYGQSLDANGTVQIDSRNGVGGVAPSMRIPLTASNVLAYAAGEDVVLNAAADYLLNLPTLPVGHTVTGSLAAGESALYRFTVAAPVWHGVHVAPTGLTLQVDAADLSVPGTYSLSLSNHATSSVPYTLRLYNLTNTIARVSSLITNLMAEHNLVGCGISLVDGDHVVMADGFGYADLARGRVADKDTVFMIGSCSKTFGALAAMQLVEEGRLDLDASITNALPDFTIHQRFANNVITPRTILTHHSGLPGDVFNEGFTIRPLLSAPDAVQAMLTNEYTLMPTNTFWAYNNSGLVLLGQMFRHITGQELDVFARERLFDRMGMTNSSIVSEEGMHKACPYIDGVVQPDEYVNLFFAGAIYSTASDMARYTRMLLADGMGDHARVISNATLRAMATKQNADIPLDQFNTLLNQGIGFILDPPTLQYLGKVIWHDGGTVYFRTLLRVALDAQLGCFISCNSAEGASLNYTVVDAALKWAFEEKTGIAPPAPLDPGTPSVAVPPPAVLALATNGVFVTGDGYDRFRYDGTNLLALFNAQSDASTESLWTHRENGWFTPTNAYAPQLSFTQTVGRVLSLLRSFDQPVTNLTLRGERSADIDGFNPAWSNRLGRWWAVNLHPDDISWHGDDLRLAWPMLNLYERDAMLLVQTENLYVMSATNDALAFAAGLGRNKGSALRTPDADTLAFMGVTYCNETNIPVLMPGSSTNGVTSGDETCWFRIPASAAPLTFDLVTDHDITAYLYTTNDSYLGQANRAHAVRLDATNAQPVMAAILRNGTNTGPWKLVVHTNAVPFYSQIPPADWPDYLVTHSNAYGDLQFGYVFVPENHEGSTNHLIGNQSPATHVLKLAVARMISTNAAAKPYFFCHGGPGTSSIRCTLAQFLRDFTTTHDVYLLDQRGINYSQPDLGARSGESMCDTQYRVDRLQDADLSTINTLESSYDLDDIAQALALTNVTLHGHSYGSLLVQTLMRRNPAWLEAVILDGVVAANVPFLAGGGPVCYNAYRALFSDIAAQPTTSVRYPGFENAYFALARQLTNNPVVVQMGGIPVPVDGFLFLQMVEGQMGISDLGDRECIPSIVWRASRGETQALAELAEYHIAFDNASSGLMSLLVNNHDFMPFFSMDEARRQCEGIPDILRQSQLQTLEEILAMTAQLEPCGQVDNTFTNPVSAPIPALVVNGTYDRATGTNWAAEVASHLPNAQLVIPPTVGHGVLFETNGCMTQLFRQFLANPTTPLDTTCLASLTLDFPPPWPANASPLTFGVPLTNTFTYPHSGAWYTLTAEERQRLTLGAPSVGSAIFHIVDTNATNLATATNAPLNFRPSLDTPYYLWIIAEESGNITFLPTSHLIGFPVFWPLLME
ncbi:MAG: alpha/beta fold hydrolase [Spartobacteria bacterium]|nr:alpha/beta fold hydrolase [Spartobacteria bacterium]